MESRSALRAFSFLVALLAIASPATHAFALTKPQHVWSKFLRSISNPSPAAETPGSHFLEIDGELIPFGDEDLPRDSNDPNRKTVCDTLYYRKNTLHLIKEIRVAGLFPEIEVPKFEASGLSKRGDKFFIVFDNMEAIGVVDDHFEFRSAKNSLAGDQHTESQFEGITHRTDKDTFIVVNEAVEAGDSTYQPLALEIRFNPSYTNYTVLETCDVNFTLTASNKGWEGVHFYDGGERGKFLLGLCEGNFCEGGSKGRVRGNGRLVVTKYQVDDDGKCSWQPVKVVRIPRTAFYQDYSEIDFNGGRVTITSQEESSVWTGDFDFEEMEFRGSGRHFYFPRNDNCEQVYCNIEGVQWIDDYRFMFTSDKSKARQPYRCMAKEEAVHIFMIPEKLK